MTVELKPVSIENWYECTQLTVKPEQLNVFPAPVVYWIAESKYVDEFESQASRQRVWQGSNGNIDSVDE
ncbi:hypothetical protein [Paenibacillus sp. IHB B 3415]|uniref:hypothetical protein n=1 Tax=Paenibacillus sp. IHB B 3415 TaxID=867080 RepID=UPI001F25CD5C|nr:hypothetical protein [Paenibacillus sp. IHB B 3415]